MTQSQVFINYNSFLHSTALRILKCKADAEDAVHDTFEKWLSIETDQIKNVKAYLTSMVTNNCLNRLKKLSNQKEESIESVSTSEKRSWFRELDITQIDFEVELSKALCVLYTKLEPLERAVIVLKEVLNYDYEVLQRILGKKSENCRQILSRAKRKLADSSEGIKITLGKSNLLDSFKRACNSGEAEELLQSLKKDIKN